jgi:hypothetical protein
MIMICAVRPPRGGKDALSVEYWFKMVLPREPDEDEGRIYVPILYRMWLEKLDELCPEIANRYKMKYIRNDLRVWFIPSVLMDGRGDKVLRETPTQKDKWYSFDTLVLTYPPIQDERLVPNLAHFLFRGRPQEPQYDDPEVQGGKIALIEVQQQSAQKPPNSLDHMHSSFFTELS